MDCSSAQQIWEAALGELQVQVSKQNFRTWLEKTVGLSLEDNQLIVGTPNTFVTEYLDKNLRSLIEKTLLGLTNGEARVVFQVDGCFRDLPRRDALPAAAASRSMFNTKYTFSSFVAGSCNQLARDAALGIAENPGQRYNPLFIYGGPGLGKTHLLHAIGHAALEKRLKVLCVCAERFTNEFVSSLYQRKTEEFNNKYRNVDILLMDDIQFLIGKEQTEVSFFHAFNELHIANRQIVVTSDLPPGSLPLLQQRLRSRLEGGLTAVVHPPDFETRLAILQAKAGQQGANLPPAVLELIARQAAQSIRQLEGLLNRVTAYAGLVGGSVTPQLAAKAIEAIADTASRAATVTPDMVIKAVAESYRLPSAELLARKRDKQTALARQVAMYLIRQETGCSLAQIGQALGGRDHATVLQACGKIAKEMESCRYLRSKIVDIQHRICFG